MATKGTQPEKDEGKIHWLPANMDEVDYSWGRSKSRKRKQKRAPYGTQDRKWQDAIGKAYRLTKKFGKKRKNGGRHAVSKKKMLSMQARNKSSFRAQYCGTVTEGSNVYSVNDNREAPKSIKPIVSAMVFTSNLEDLRDELYPK